MTKQEFISRQQAVMRNANKRRGQLDGCLFWRIGIVQKTGADAQSRFAGHDNYLERNLDDWVLPAYG